FVQIIDVDVIGAEPAQARVRRAHDPFARKPARVRPLPHRVGELGCDYPLVALVGDGAAGDLLGAPAVVGVGAVDEIDPRLARLGDDALRGRLVGRAAEHHGAEAQRGYFQAAASEIAVVHARLPHCSSFSSAVAEHSKSKLAQPYAISSNESSPSTSVRSPTISPPSRS